MTHDLVAAVRETAIAHPAETLRSLGDRFEIGDDRWRVQVAACVDAAFGEAMGLSLFDTQLYAGLMMMERAVAEMATGEGKTFTAAIPAAAYASAGRGCHVATANDYLAARDVELLRPVFAALGLSAEVLPEQQPDGRDDRKRAAYAADVTYGTGHEFGFDYLRDRTAQPPSGLRFADRLAASRPERMQRRLFAAVIDEIDHVLLDDALSPLILSNVVDPIAPDADAHRRARELALRLPETAYRVVPQPRLTPLGQEMALDELTDAVAAQLARPWLDYVGQALHAEYGLAADSDYLIGPPKPVERGGDGQPEIQLIDASTGRVFADRTWSDGLHQAVECKEGLPIRGGSTAMARITKQRLYGQYEHLCGMTGTATGCEREFREVYDLAVRPVPLRRPSRRIVEPTVAFADEESKWAAVAVEAADRLAAGQPVLIGTASIASSDAAAGACRTIGLDAVLLNGCQTADEADIVAAAGEAGRLTVSTNLAGRGTDIKLSEAARDAGGLHVIVAEAPVSQRVQRQLVGRAARQGDPGSAVMLVSADDPFITRQAPWLAAAMRSGRDGVASLKRVQSQVDRAAERQRIELWERDVDRDGWIEQIARRA